jgi:hypothetical protein
MPSRDTASVLETIAANVDLARRFIEGLSREDFLVDVRAQYAVTRCLEIISEASRRLPEELRPGIRLSRGTGLLVLATSIGTTTRTFLQVFCGLPFWIILMACGRQYGSNSKHLEREVYE